MATANTQPSNTADGSREVLISADSHVMEAADFMEKRLPDNLRSRAPRFPEERIGERHQAHAGGRNRNERVGEMETDGLSAEVLYPSYPMKLYSLGRQDADLQEACFRAYNDWLVEYCQAAPDRLIGIGMISAYDIESAVLETQRCKQLGMGGVMIWQCPPEELPFSSSYYDPFWQVAEELRMPVSIHSLTGIGEGRAALPRPQRGPRGRGPLQGPELQSVGRGKHAVRRSSSPGCCTASPSSGWSWWRMRSGGYPSRSRAGTGP